MNEDLIALIDLDSSVADYDRSMREWQAKLRSPGEPEIEQRDGAPAWMEARRKLIQGQPGFWKNLARLELGFEVVDELRAASFRLNILTRGPAKQPLAWAEKLEWAQMHLPDAEVTVTMTDKSGQYGRILVDDYPPFFNAWLKYRPRGLVICVAQVWNADVNHPNIFRYDGTNRAELKVRIKEAYDRTSGPIQQA